MAVSLPLVKRYLRICSLAAMFALLSAWAQAQPSSPAQQERAPLPITTGTGTSAMDAPDTNSDLETYTHSPVVQAAARKLGLTTNQASRYFEDFNSGVLIAVLLYFLLKYVPGKLRGKREGIAHDLQRARQATADAEARMQRVEARLRSLDGEVEALRMQAAENGRREEARIHASLEEERQRIIHSAEQEIAAAQAAAERGLKRYASNLAVDRAAERVRLTPETDRALIEEFLTGLGEQLAHDPAFRGTFPDTFKGKN